MATSSRAGVIRSSRSPYGERGLKFDGDLTELAGGAGRSPYGERGLKFTAQGAYPVGSSRSPYGERGLKYRNYRNCAGFPCRSPYGERGLKLGVTVYAVVFGVSLFLRRAWIEMSLHRLDLYLPCACVVFTSRQHVCGSRSQANGSQYHPCESSTHLLRSSRDAGSRVRRNSNVASVPGFLSGIRCHCGK